MNLARPRIASFLGLMAVMMLMGCQGSSPEESTSGMGVEAALGMQSTEALTVTGFALVFENGEVVLADQLTTANPPEPEGATVVVRGFDEEVPSWDSSEGMRWTTEPVRVTGTLKDGVLTATATKSG